MHLLILIDNITNNYKWINIYNNIKRWMIYWLNDLIIKNKITSLTISKTYPELNYVKLENDKLDIIDIINLFEAIIIRKCEDYNINLNLKNIFQFITTKLINKDNTNQNILEEDINYYNNIPDYTDIFILSSINNFILDSEVSIYIYNELNKSNLNKINFVNFSNRNFLPFFEKVIEESI